MYKQIIIILLIISMMINQAIGEEMKTVKSVSMYQLLVTPEKYDGELIIVVGYTLVSDRGVMIYPHGIDYAHNIPMNKLWISINREERKKYFKNQKKYSIIEGTFNAKKKGNTLANYGVIEKITRFDIWDYSYDSKQ